LAERPEENERPESSTPVDAAKVGGVTVDEAAIGQELIQRGPEEMRGARGTSLRQSHKQAGTLRQHFRDGTVAFSAEVREKNKSSRTESGEFTTKARLELDQLANTQIRGAMGKVQESMKSNIALAVQRDLRAQSEVLAKLGIPKQTDAKLAQLSATATNNAMNNPFPGTQTTTKDRLAREAGKAKLRYDRVIKSKLGEDSTKAMDYMRRGLHDPKPGHTRVDGGSVGKSLQRINRTEQARAAREANLALYKELGVAFSYWRLSSSHAWHSGHEVCEILASGTGAGVIAKLAEFDVDLSDVDISGMYLVVEYPSLPHPHCMCYQEPWHPPKELSMLILDQLVENRPFPKDTMSSSQVPDNVAASLNAVAGEMGINAQFDRHAASMLGIDGAANLLMAQVEGFDRVRMRGTLQEIKERMLPQIMEGVNKAGEHRDKLEAAVLGESALSSITKATEVANIRMEYARELQQAGTNAALLQSLENHIGGERKPMHSNSATTKEELGQFMLANGFPPESGAYKILKDKGKYIVEMDPQATSTWPLKKHAKRNDLLRRIKADEIAISPLGMQDHIEAWQPETDDPTGGFKIAMHVEQQSGIKFIEEAKQSLLHFGAGLGKTPTIIGAVSDLHAKGEIDAGCISTPAALRNQMVQEIMQFNEKGKIVLYTSASSRVDVERDIREKVRDVVMENVPFVRGEDGEKLPDRSRLPEAYADTIEAEIATRLTRVTVKGFQDDVVAMERNYAEDRRDGALFTIISHDDLAASAAQAKDTFDFMAIDEIHQMTSASPTGGSAKAEGLQKLVGGRLKYRVGLTGTAAKNNMGEFWDISNWLNPGQFPPKDEFTKQYDNITLNSNVFGESMVAQLRREMDTYTFTRASPLDKRLNNPFRDYHPDGTKRSDAEKAKYLRELTMTPKQKERAAQIEGEFTGFKMRQLKMDAEAKVKLRSQRTDDEASLRAYFQEFPELEKVLYDTDIDPNKFRPTGMRSRKMKRAIKYRDRIEGVKNTFNPESWRNNQHHKNIHGGDWKTNAKAQEVVRLLDNELKDKKPIIHLERIGSKNMLRAALESKGLVVGEYHGGMSDAEKSTAKQKFNSGEYDTLLVTRAGSTGVNLQKKSTGTIHFDTPWTFAEFAQREARNWRTKQKKDVDSYVLTNVDSNTDRRRLELMQQKGMILSALDEVVKVEDRMSPLTLLDTQKRKEFTTYSEIKAKRSKVEAESLLKAITKELALNEEIITATVNTHAPAVALMSEESRENKFGTNRE